MGRTQVLHVPPLTPLVRSQASLSFTWSPWKQTATDPLLDNVPNYGFKPKFFWIIGKLVVKLVVKLVTSYCKILRIRIVLPGSDPTIHITAILLIRAWQECKLRRKVHVVLVVLTVAAVLLIRAWQNVIDCCGIYVRDKIVLLAWQDVLHILLWHLR